MLKVKGLLNINYISYSFIDQNLAQIIYNRLDINFISLFKPRCVKDFDNNISFYSITHVLYSILTVQNYIEFTISMLITSLNQH